MINDNLTETRFYVFEPASDITAYELALIIREFGPCRLPAERMASMPVDLRRHWREG